MRQDGDTGGLWVLSTSMFACLMCLVHLKLAFMIQRVDTWVVVTWLALNFGPYYFYLLVTDYAVALDPTHFTFDFTRNTPLVILVQLLVVGTSYVCNLAWLTYQTDFMNDPRHVARR